MCQQVVSVGRPEPTLTEGPEGESECGQGGESAVSSLPAPSTVLSAEQQDVVLRHLSTAYAKADEVAGYFASKGYCADADDLRSEATAYLIDLVMKGITDGRLYHAVEEFLPNHLKRTTAQQYGRRKRRKEHSVGDWKTVKTPPVTDTQPVEVWLNENLKLNAIEKDIILRVMQMRPKERLTDRLTAKECRIWKEKVRPTLRQWAILKGYWEKGGR